ARHHSGLQLSKVRRLVLIRAARDSLARGVVATSGSTGAARPNQNGSRCVPRHGGRMNNIVTQEPALPDMKVSIRQVVGIDSDKRLPAYPEPDEHVPDVDPDYRFARPTTLAILAGFAKNRRVIVTGYHGTGKSTHIEQVAARLNWPCVRVNLDSHISRIDLIG